MLVLLELSYLLGGYFSVFSQYITLPSFSYYTKAHTVYEKGAEKGVFYSKWQRSLYNVDGLAARPWWTKQQTGQSAMLKVQS